MWEGACPRSRCVSRYLIDCPTAIGGKPPPTFELRRHQAPHSITSIQRAVASKPDAFAGDDSRIDLESVDLTELFVEMRTAGEISQQALCAVFLAHPLLALVLEQEGEEDATNFKTDAKKMWEGACPRFRCVSRHLID